MKKIDKLLYTAQAKVSGGRDGKVTTENGKLSLNLSMVKELGGPGGPGTDPEQLFAAGYASCFLSATKLVASKEKINLPAETAINALVGLGRSGTDLALQVELQISIPGVDHATAQSLVEKAHNVCPYSNATRGNIEVKLTVL